MILSTTKKVIAIYRVSSLFFLLASLFSVATAQTPGDLNSYCFDKNVNLRDVHNSLKILLLPKDIVEIRDEDGCLDIVTSLDRGKLFEKEPTSPERVQTDRLPLNEIDCRLDFKTTKKTKIDTSHFKIGEKNFLNKGESANQSVSTMELLLGAGKNGEIGIGEQNLKVICQPFGNDTANLIFSYSEIKKTAVNSQVMVKKGEWLNIASVVKDLNDKTKTLGIPQTEISQTTEKNETLYELQFK
jgi:hypothetical protein